MGKTGDELDIHVVRLREKFADLRDHCTIDQPIQFVEWHPGVSVWGSLPCTPWPQWQHMATQRNGPDYEIELEERRKESLALVANFVRVAREVRKHGEHAFF